MTLLIPLREMVMENDLLKKVFAQVGISCDAQNRGSVNSGANKENNDLKSRKVSHI